MKSYRVIDEFGKDITKIVDVVFNPSTGEISVINEFGINISKNVDIVIK